ncbi:hypothetical protein PI126_g784 [Phytophthora idaei]|nr:hypothetical protein PI126_g784 [Phytophthora idaei]
MLVKAQQNARGAAAVWKWKEKEEPIYAIDSHTMFFVNQDEATEQLLKIHQRNYNRAKRGVVGNTWAIPLVDNVFGLGKTTFGWEYIRNCQNMWDKSPLKTNSGFLDTVRSCHTIKIEFTPQQLLGTNGDFDDMKALNNTIDDICSYFAENYGFRPLALAPEMLPPYCAHKIFPKNLTNEVGPLFIMIDEIGMAFNHIKLGEIDHKERFMAFCGQVLAPLFLNERLFFLIAGRAAFMNYVGLTPRGNMGISPSPFEFPRLSLGLLPESAIRKLSRLQTGRE